MLIPDFCQESIHQLIPYTVQAIRMPGRDDLLLTDEEKTYIMSRFSTSHRAAAEAQQMLAVAGQLRGAIEGLRSTDYRAALGTGVALWKNYLTSIQLL